MEFSKIIKIKEKCFTKEDIIKIARTVFDSCNDDTKVPYIKINFIDGSSISGNELNLFDNSLTDRKLAESITITYDSYVLNEHIRIFLTSNNHYNDSKIEVTSSNENWYNAMISKLTEDLSTTRNQAKLFSILGNINISIFLSIVISLLFGILTVLPIINILKGNNILISNDLFSVIFIVIFVFYMILSSSFLKKLCDSFPSIEFYFGPGYNNPSLKFKKVLNYIFLTIIPSIVLTVIDKLL